MKRSRSTLLVAALALLMPLTAACDSASPRADEPMAAAAAAPVSEDGAKTDASVSDAPDSARMVIRRANLQLRGDAPQAVIARATALTEQYGGYVAASNTHAVGDDIQQIDATLRVPSERFEAVLSSLRSEGELLHESLSGEDVTEQFTDISAHLRSKRALEERMLAILAKVDNVEDALRVETQLTGVRTEIERLEGRKRVIENRVSLATIELSVSSPVMLNARQPETVASRLDRALDDAGSAFIAVIGGLIRIFGVVLPLGLLGLPVAIGARIVWLRRRRQQAIIERARQAQG